MISALLARESFPWPIMTERRSTFSEIRCLQGQNWDRCESPCSALASRRGSGRRAVTLICISSMPIVHRRRYTRDEIRWSHRCVNCHARMMLCLPGPTMALVLCQNVNPGTKPALCFVSGNTALANLSLRTPGGECIRRPIAILFPVVTASKRMRNAVNTS